MASKLALCPPPVIDLIHDCIKDAGEQGISSGHLYSMLMGRLSLDTYTTILLILKGSGKVRESNNILTSILKIKPRSVRN